jgi:PAS domain S-box-containing protein
MSEPSVTGAPPALPLDPRLRELLRDLPEAQASVVDALIRDRDRLVALAERRAAHLQRLHEVSATLSRSLDRDDIERELARHAARLIRSSGVVVARPAPSAGVAITLHWREGGERDVESAAPVLGAMAEVVQSGRSSRTSSATGDAGGNGTVHVLAAPLMLGAKLVGVLAVYATGAPFGTEDEELLQTLGTTAATALVNAMLFAESLHEKRQSEALAAVAGALGSSLRLAEVLRLSLRHCTAILGSEGAAVALRRGDYLHIVATEGSADPLQGLYVPIAESAAAQAMLGARVLIVNDAAGFVGAYERTRTAAGIGKTISAPLLTPDGPIGLLSAINRTTDFTDADARVLERLASQLALAVVNARLYEEARDATRELSTAFDAMTGGMAVLDGEGFIVRHNARLAVYAGLGDGVPLTGRALFDALLREHRPVTPEDPLGAALLRSEIGRGTVRQKWSGRTFDIVASPHPAGGAVVTVDDVTEARVRDEALERAEARYARLVEAAEDAICTLDVDGKITAVNRSLERALGVSRASILGSPFDQLLLPEEREDKRQMLAATLGGGRQRQELRFRSPSGETRISTVISVPIYERGRVSGVLAIVRDVTDERALLEQVVRREKLAALGELVGGVAHEVNSPLTSILAFAQILQASHPSDEEARKAVNTIVNEAKRAARIVGKFLTFARQQPSEKMRTDVNQVLLDTIELRRYPLRMQQIALDLELADKLPSTWADPFQLQQVFINLLNNAEQALAAQSGDRRIVVRTDRRGDDIVATLSDTGPGIAPEHLPHIFNPFYTTKARSVGTGLGLSISFGIVREHGGVIRVRSEPGKGAAFEVSLPIVAPPSGTNG